MIWSVDYIDNVRYGTFYKGGIDILTTIQELFMIKKLESDDPTNLNTLQIKASQVCELNSTFNHNNVLNVLAILEQARCLRHVRVKDVYHPTEMGMNFLNNLESQIYDGMIELCLEPRYEI